MKTESYLIFPYKIYSPAIYCQIKLIFLNILAAYFEWWSSLFRVGYA